MNQTILRIIGSREWELPFIRMSVAEADGLVDKIVITEHDHTHTGDPHQFELESYFETSCVLPSGSELSYHAVRMDPSSVRTHKTKGNLHWNEMLMRGSFEQFISVYDDDIVICVDADEVIYRRSFPKLIAKVSRSRRRDPLAIPMHQFFYRMNYLWTDIKFASATIGRASALREMETPWRDAHRRMRGKHGCHFSWNLTVDQMIAKLQTYSHHLDYGHLARREVLEEAVQAKAYPFREEKPFTIRELGWGELDQYLPASWRHEQGRLAHLLPSQS